MLGVISALSLMAAVFFVRFWRETRDIFFLPFVVFFLTEVVNRVILLLSTHPNEGSVWIYLYPAGGTSSDPGRPPAQELRARPLVA